MKIIHSKEPEQSQYDPDKNYCEGCEAEIPESEIDQAYFDDDCCWTCVKCWNQLKAEAAAAGMTVAEYTKSDE